MIRICDPTWHPFLYERFRRKARLLMSLERAGHTLQPTALVHEGIIRIFRQRKPPRTPDEWLAAMAVMMRRVLVDSVRRKRSRKRGGHLTRVDLPIDQVAEPELREDLIALDEALDRYKAVDPQAARIVVLRFFGGMTGAEVSRLVGIPSRTVDRKWASARVWLFRDLSGGCCDEGRVKGEQELFEEAVELSAGLARRRFLASRCRWNSVLRARVERMLDDHDRAGSFLEEPAPEQLARGGLRRTAGFASAAKLAGDDHMNAPAFLAAPLVAGDLGSLGSVRVVRRLSDTPFGPVLEGIDGPADRPVLVRALAAKHAQEPSVRKRFLGVARKLAMMRHPSLPSIRSVEERPVPYLVTKQPAGESLADRLARGDRFSVATALRLGAQLAEALAVVHEQGLVHRQLSPATVFVTAGREPDRAVLVDVGLAQAVDAEANPLALLPGPWPDFLAPEQAVGKRLDRCDHRPDLFALGSLLVAMVTGHSPFAAATGEGALRRVSDGAASMPESIPAPLAAVVAALHQADPTSRPKSGLVVATLLNDAAAKLC
ncbi:MAG: Serine/threonine-protein kinase PknB [Planctomycetota bacterium]|jgi:RNA polymerase sigma factor (TIGR02999 family)